MLNNKKMIDPRVKTQAKRKNYSSRALKWDIVCICSLNTFGFTIRFEKRLGFQFLRFCKKVIKSLLIQNWKKRGNDKIDTFCF